MSKLVTLDAIRFSSLLKKFRMSTRSCQHVLSASSTLAYLSDSQSGSTRASIWHFHKFPIMQFSSTILQKLGKDNLIQENSVSSSIGGGTPERPPTGNRKNSCRKLALSTRGLYFRSGVRFCSKI